MKKQLIVRFMALLLACCAMLGCKPEEEEKYGTIYGTVTDFATGEPVGNANVKLRPNGETTLTGNDGTYEFIDLEAGKYSLMLSKAQYADLDDDYIIELAAGKQVKRDVQLRKKVASLKIVDMSGNPLDTLDFGDEESVRVKTFNVFNDGTETLTCSVTYDCEWITNVSGLENQVQSNQTVPVTVKIDRVALADGVNTTFLSITSANGSNEIVVKATFKGTAVINTKDATNVTSSSVTLGGNIIDDGGRPVTARGICYSTLQSPDIYGDHTEDGSGTGEFNHNITGLSASTTYYARAYATNRNGTYYASNIVSFTTTNGLPTVTTTAVTDVTTNTAKSGGEVVNNGGYNVTARGVCWNTMGSPDLSDEYTTNGNGNGVFTSNLTGLTLNTTYYVRAYATNQMGTNFGEEYSFVTNDGSIAVTTNSVSNVTSTTAMCGGNISVSTGNTFPIISRGVCWSTSHNPTTNDNHTSDGTGAGSFTSSLIGLNVNTTYYVRAYAINEIGTFYGEEKSFSTTVGLPIVTTKIVTNVSPLSATCGGTVTSDGGFTVTARGICWSTVTNPTIDDQHSTNGTGIGEFIQSITDLQNSTTYHVRAYATNSNGTAYGEDEAFTTTSGAITVTTSNVTNVGPTSATCGGNASVTADNNLPITAKGVCWSTGHNPTISGDHTTDGSGPGTFNSSISGLTINTQYYVRAYATNQLGTYYGEEKSFTTTVGLPSVITTAPSLNGTTVTTGGNVTSDGGFTVTARGVCYGSLPNPDLSSTYSHTTDGSGTGYYTSTFSLTESISTYYIRAYATNANGTTYGEQMIVIKEYYELPTFTFNGHVYRVAPDPQTDNYEQYLSWGDANDYCANLTLYGHADWRMPTQEELYTMWLNWEAIGGWCYSYYGYNNYYHILYHSSTLENNGSNHIQIKWEDGTIVTWNESGHYESYNPQIGRMEHFNAHVRPIRVEN